MQEVRWIIEKYVNFYDFLRIKDDGQFVQL